MSRRDELLSVWAEHKNIGYIPCGFLDYNFLRHPKYVKERPEGCDGYDWFGVHWTYQPETNSSMVSPGYPHIITDITKWEDQVKFPDLEQYDWQAIAVEETANWDRENKISMVMVINGIFERSHHLLGFENALMAMYEEPEAYKALLHRIADYKCDLIKIISKYYKPDVIMMHDDYGAADRTLMSPDCWREFIKEPLARMVKTAHNCGMMYEHHSCGFVEPLIGDLIEIEVDSLNPLQRPCNDLKKIKELYDGKITFVGGFNSQGIIENPTSAEEDIMNDIQTSYDILAPGGGYASFPVVINMEKFAPLLIKKHKQIACNYADS